MNALHLSGFSINFFLTPNQRLFVFGVIFIVGVIEFVHLIGYSMGIVPNEFLRLVKLLGFEYLFLYWVGGMR